jgi:chemotaxis signal transduction protein
MKISHSRSRRAASSSVRESAILFTVAGKLFAIAADAVDEVRNIDGLAHCNPSSRYPKLAKVTFTLERQGCRYFVVDAGAHFGMTSVTSEAARLMVMRNTASAVLVDGIERMHDIAAIQLLPAAFRGEERRWYRGLTVLNQRVVPVVNSDAFLTRAELTLLEATYAPASKEMAIANA